MPLTIQESRTREGVIFSVVFQNLEYGSMYSIDFVNLPKAALDKHVASLEIRSGRECLEAMRLNKKRGLL